MVLNLQFIISSIMALDFLISYCIWNGICKLHVFNCETVTTNVNGPTVHFACLQIPLPLFHHWVKCCLCNRCLCPDLFPHYGYGISLTIATNKPQEDPATGHVTQGAVIASGGVNYKQILSYSSPLSLCHRLHISTLSQVIRNGRTGESCLSF